MNTPIAGISVIIHILIIIIVSIFIYIGRLLKKLMLSKSISILIIILVSSLILYSGSMIIKASLSKNTNLEYATKLIKNIEEKNGAKANLANSPSQTADTRIK